jgi:hypothetical protein
MKVIPRQSEGGLMGKAWMKDRPFPYRSTTVVSIDALTTVVGGTEAEIVQIGSGRLKGRIVRGHDGRGRVQPRIVLASYLRQGDIQPHQRPSKQLTKRRRPMVGRLWDWS